MAVSTTLTTGNSASGLVTFSIKIDGEAISKIYGVVSIVINKEINKIASANLIIQDGSSSKQDFEISDEDTFIPGKEIEILAGYHSDESTIFKGIIIKHGIKIRSNGNSMLILDCKDKAVKLTVGPKNKYFVGKTDSDVIEEIIGTYSIDADIEATNITHEGLVQFNCTDWDFILSRLDANGKVCITNDGIITVKAPALDGDAALTLTYGKDIVDFDAAMDARTQYQAVKAVTWDAANFDVLETDATDPAIDGNGNITPADLAAVIGLETLSLNHTGMLPQEELQAWADAQLLKSQLSKIRGRVGFMGSVALSPGDLLALAGLGERMNGNVYVSAIRHEISEGTWRTDAQFGLSPEWFTQTYNVNALPASGVLPAVEGLQIGVVSQLKEDPEGEDRILVKMPIIDNSETGVWARIACLDAGNNRGTFFRPEIGDEVVVGFLNSDPRKPVVLGGLNSSSKPSPSPATDENDEKGYVSRSEMKLTFNDDKKSVKIETPAGKVVSMDEDAGEIKLEDENGNKIVMNADGITIESKKKIVLKTNDDIEVQGKDIKHTAQASFKADGTAGIELTSSAIAKLKGSLVQIN
jgi:Rhs element Vgr protein